MTDVRPELIFVAGPQCHERAVLMNNVMVAGRSPQADIRIREEFVSRRQLQFELTSQGWVVENLTRSGMIRINGKKYKVGKKVVLGSGDCISTGAETQMLFVEPQDDPNKVLADYRRDHPLPQPVPVSPPPQASPDDPSPAGHRREEGSAGNAADENEGPSGDDIAAQQRKAKIRKYAIGFGIYVAAIIATVVILMSVKKAPQGVSLVQPKRLDGAEIRKALTSKLVRSPNEVAAERELNKARSFFLKRSAEDPNLYLCVKSFRLYLAYRRKDQRTFDPEDERKFRIAREELVQKTQEIYDDAWAAENNHRWKDAYTELERLLRCIPVKEASDDPSVKSDLIDNVLDHSRYVSKYLSR